VAIKTSIASVPDGNSILFSGESVINFKNITVEKNNNQGKVGKPFSRLRPTALYCSSHQYRSNLGSLALFSITVTIASVSSVSCSMMMLLEKGRALFLFLFSLLLLDFYSLPKLSISLVVGSSTNHYCLTIGTSSTTYCLQSPTRFDSLVRTLILRSRTRSFLGASRRRRRPLR